MRLLFVSPDYASHYGPLAVLAGAARDGGAEVVVATGHGLRGRVVADGFAWRPLQLAAGSNTGVVGRDPAIDRFLAATRRGPVATLRLQARDRATDLLWEPETVARRVAALCDELQPDRVVVDHVSFGSTLAMHATGRPFVSVVPGHPSQLPVADERYGVPARWPSVLQPPADELRELDRLVDEVTGRFTARWNDALARIAPDLDPVDDAFRVHGGRVLYNSVAGLGEPGRAPHLPPDHRFVGPLVRDEVLPDELAAWAGDDDRPRAYVAFGTFLSHRSDVLATAAGALRSAGFRAAIAIGATPVGALGGVPDDWVVAPTLPQVALLARADVAVHHGGNNSAMESLVAGVPQVVLPFSTDQFANASDLERAGRGVVVPPGLATPDTLADAITAWARRPSATVARPSCDDLYAALVAPFAPAPSAHRPIGAHPHHAVSAAG